MTCAAVHGVQSHFSFFMEDKMKTRKRIFAGIIAASVLISSAFAKKAGKAADYPKKGITVICPWGAGGGTDAILRALCSTAEKYLGTTITVENKTGGAGAIGHAAIKTRDRTDIRSV